jgi:hypothetical protein
MLLSGVCLGVAFMFRFDAIIFLLPLLFYALLRRLGGVGHFLIGLGLIILAQGLLDLATWGAFLHSPIAYVTQNILQGKSAIFGEQSPVFYVGVLGLHLSCVLLLPYAVEKRESFYFIGLNALVFLLAYSMVPHKEMRFIMPVLPLFFILAGRGMQNAAQRYDRLIVLGLLALTVISNAYLAWSFLADTTAVQAMAYVGAQSDVTGVAYDLFWCDSGGYTYLHRPVPLVQIVNETTDPLLKDVTCSSPNMTLIGYQCSPLADVLDQKDINYIVAGNRTSQTALAGYGFQQDAQINGMRVFKRTG